MVRQFNYNTGTKIRLWIDELPNSAVNSSQFIEHTAKTNCDKNWNIRSVAIEFYSQRHISNYGLLGIEILPVPKPSTLDAKIYYANDGLHFNDTLAFNKKTVFSALPEEYVETVSQKAQEFFKQNINLPAGTLIIRTAAHCQVGSSMALFGIITNALLSILSLNKHDFLDEEVQKLLEELLIR